MKISVIGNGKTGSKVVEQLGESLAEVFNTANPLSAAKLRSSDAVIIFVPGSAVNEIMGTVLEARIPAVWGSTGNKWPADLDGKVRRAGTKWVTASNFSLGMNLVRKSIEALSAGARILNQPDFHIHEMHHVHKIDSPSGTALKWQEWLGIKAEISSERVGDVIGVHELKITSGTERITLKHEALDRGLFAEGAIWAAHQLVENVTLKEGLYTFSELFDQITGSRKK